MAEAVAGEVGQAEVDDDLVPVRRVPHGRGGEGAALRSYEQPVVRFFTFCEAFEDRSQRFEDRDPALLASFGLLGDEPALAGVGLPGDDDDVLVEPDITGLGTGDLGRACVTPSSARQGISKPARPSPIRTT